jgi:hypothetical protein
LNIFDLNDLHIVSGFDSLSKFLQIDIGVHEDVWSISLAALYLDAVDFPA